MGRHVGGVVALYALVGTVVGLAAAAVIGIETRLTRAFCLRRPRAGKLLRAASYGALAGGASASTAFRTFAGQQIQTSSIAVWAPYAFIALVALGGCVFVLALFWVQAAVARGRRVLPLGLALVALALAAGAMYVDLTVFVALYARLHAMLEAAAALLVVTVLVVVLDHWSRRYRPGRLVVQSVATLAASWLFAVIAVQPLRAWRDHALRHVWLEPAYAGRALARVQTVESFLRSPLSWRGATLSRLDQLRDSYDLSTTALSPAWEEPLAEPAALSKKIAALRTQKDLNILVYYVDTLRYDVASDPAIMPNVVEFAKQSLEFRRVYAPGSDTLHSLPGITSGSYEFDRKTKNGVLQVARRARMKRALVIPRSANEFLTKLYPSFEFDSTIEIPDYRPEKKDVWGYGADLPTCERIVDRTLEWLGENPDQRFFLWLFNFDQHNWRELDRDWVYAVAARHQVPDEALLNWRYRVVATAIDREFARLLDGLHRLGRDKDTIVVFVSDHGEGLGRDGFWVHSIFLWDTLVRVPLVMRIPGLGHRVVYDKVSLVDIAPTLARYMLENADTRGYQGEDLVSYLVPDRPPRRLPILLAGSSQENLVRIGIVDPDKDWKLVLPLESGTPELYDLSVSDPDWLSVAENHPTEVARLLSQLVRSPLFPRSSEDADVKARGERAKAAAAAAAKP